MSEQQASQTIPLPSGHTAEPILGYRIIERIGVGGYGEVWKAEAPGGLTKALKFVYGHMDDTRASREMKALSRIKEVRHPFLLSLERIEVVDGHLIIVTELAQSNLKELFVECQHAGMVGIPRDRLLGYLRDAADGLDYMCSEFNLQHLDVKPENLLLVADRVKVADFGLVRELFDSSASMMGGLTPNYAPPEVFDGRPDSHSDQYSLAIVFQEMLTGVLPFSGRTAAQLAAQHMHSQPRLDPLPPSDRMTIARAMSKDPSKRFPSCRALVDTLANPTRSGGTATGGNSAAAGPIISRGSNSAVSNKTISLDLGAPETNTNSFASEGPAAKEMVGLPPLELTGQFQYRPTLFLGIGGMATATMRALRRRLQDRLGDLEQVPAFQMLALDTDQAALAAACSDTEKTTLRAQDTLAVPLRRTQEYREESDRFLSWMSRRWIYNIPRSRQTEGLRPLGRLALVDHWDEVWQRLRQTITMATDPDHVAASSQATGCEFDATAPRIFIIASIAGGTGSGMVLDLAYAARQLLTELGFPDDGVCGVLTHHTERRTSAHDLAIANSLACLQELNHYSEPSSHYPGDVVCGLASFNGRTFHHGYVVHLGDELGAEEFADAADRVAEFLYCNAVTGAGEFFDQCRQTELSEYEVSCSETSLRTFGISQLGLANSNVPDAMAELVCRQLVDDWRGGAPADSDKPARFSDLRLGGKKERKTNSIDQSIDQLAAEQCTALQLDIERLSKVAMVVAKQEMGRDPDSYFTALVHQFIADHMDGPPDAAQLNELLATIDSMLGANTPDGRSPDDNFVSLQATINETMVGVAEDFAATLKEWIVSLVNNSRTRIHGAQRAAKWLDTHLQKLAQQAADRADGLAKDAAQTRQQLVESLQENKAIDPAGDPLTARYYRLRLNQVVLRSVRKTLRRITEVHVAQISDKLRDITRELGMIAAQFDDVQIEEPPQPSGRGDTSFLEHVRWAAQTALAHRSADLVAQVEVELLNKDGGLRALLIENSNGLGNLSVVLRTTARRVLRRAVREVNVADVVLSATPVGDQPTDDNPLRRCLQLADPHWNRCGGARRLMAMVPSSCEPEVVEVRFRKHLDEPLNLLFDADGDLVFCYEAEGLSPADIVAALTAGRPDLAQVASRLHTRIDVQWRSL